MTLVRRVMRLYNNTLLAQVLSRIASSAGAFTHWQGTPRRFAPSLSIGCPRYESAAFRRRLRRRGVKSTFPIFEQRPRKKPKRGRSLRMVRLVSSP